MEKYSIDRKDWQMENQRLTAMLPVLVGFNYSFVGDEVEIVLFWR